MRETPYSLEEEIAKARIPRDTIFRGNRGESLLPIPRRDVNGDPECIRRCIEQLWSLPEDCRDTYLEKARISPADVHWACGDLGLKNPLERRDFRALPFDERLQLLLFDVVMRHPDAMGPYALECLQAKIPATERVTDLNGISDADFHGINIRKKGIEQMNTMLGCIRIQRLITGQLLDTPENGLPQ